jgi:Kdo2-lipid IVA lauroyltransferase/acyltransferase
MRYQFRHVVEYGALRAIAGIINALPYRLALCFAWCLARLAFVTARKPVDEARRRIRSVFGDRYTPQEVNRIAWTSFRNLFFNSVEMFRSPRMTLQWVQSVCDSEKAMQEAKKALAPGRGGITAVPHMGNWELAGIVSHLNGLPIFSIAATQKNPLADRYLNHLRSALGAQVMARGSGTMKAVLQKLKNGGLLAILPDVRVRTPGVLIPFLGGTANLGTGMALFARHADVPILPGMARRIGWSRHVLHTFPPIYPDKSLDKDQDVARMTAHVMNLIEKAIREEPEQWFWYNRRWILDPIG